MPGNASLGKKCILSKGTLPEVWAIKRKEGLEPLLTEALGGICDICILTIY